MTDVLATLRNVRVTLGGRSILSGVDADLMRGQITALIGLNGSGKTTLLKALIRECPYQGEVKYFCGHDHTRHRPEQIGYVPQRLAIDVRMPLTVREFFALAIQRRPLFFGVTSRVTKTAERLLARVGAGHLLHSPVAKLSGGEMQRILLSLALEPHPELLLLDEPAAGIDFADQKPFYDLLAEINRERKVTILLVSHDLSVVSDKVHHELCLKNGRIECQGPPGDVLTTEMMDRIFGQGKQVFAHRHDDGSVCDHHHSHGL